MLIKKILPQITSTEDQMDIDEPENNNIISNSAQRKRGCIQFGVFKNYQEFFYNEKRIENELKEIERNANDYKMIKFTTPPFELNKETGEIRLCIQFVNYFSVYILLKRNYPYSVPLISFFGIDQNKAEEYEKKVTDDLLNSREWTVTKGIKEIIMSIKKIINTRKKYSKRRFSEFEDKFCIKYSDTDISFSIKFKK